MTDNDFLTRSLHYDIIESVRFSKGHEKPRDDPGSNLDAVEHTDKAWNILLTELTKAVFRPDESENFL